ncbi:SusC/RagA family TonB-linked outer membrane protein [Pseudobacter ginsenosidimutans]|nr:SusC/RagA family TonB-linked outer membrane protein [Pseudobacter ginsenosidimutans]
MSVYYHFLINQNCSQVMQKTARHKLAQILLVMRLTIMLMTVALVHAHASGRAQSITLSGKDLTLKQVFADIEKQTGYVVFSKKGTLAETKTVTFSAQNMPLKNFLDLVLKDQPLGYVISGKTIHLSRKVETPAQPTHQFITLYPEETRLPITGRITDSTGAPLAGATIAIRGGKITVTTDASGKFTIQAEAGDVLVISYVGFATENFKVKAGTKDIQISLSPAASVIENVVVTGIFNKPKESYTGATRTISEKEIREFQGRNIFVTLGNIDPAFNVVANNSIGSDPNRIPEIQLRGTRNLPNIDQFQAGTDAGQLAMRDQQFQYQAAALNAPLVIMDGFPISLQRMMDLNMNEIASITLLKDGSATALYGSQGANGVIVITTKQPAPGKLRLTYRGGINVSLPDLSSYNLLNARDKLALEKASGYFSNGTMDPANNLLLEKYYNDVLALVESGVNTDWLSKPLRTQVDQNHSVRLEGGDNAFRYAMEGQYNRINGVMKGSSRETVNGTVTLSYRLNKLNFSNNLRVGNSKSNESPWGSFSSYAKLNPYWSPYDANGNIVQTFRPFERQYWQQGEYSNPIANPMYDATLNTFNKSAYTSIVNNFQVEWRPINRVTLNGGISINSNQSTGDNFKPASHSAFSQYALADVFRKGTYDYSTGKDFSFTSRISANYYNLFNGVHGLTVGLSGELFESKTTNYGFSAEGFPDETVDFLGRALQYAQNGAPRGTESTVRRVGTVGSVNYVYDNRYFADVTYRIDGASQFGSNNRYAPFYSLGAGWNLHEEAFLRHLDYIDRLRLRGSFGVTGNQAFSAYQPLATYSYIMRDRYKNWIGATQSTLGNSNLKWQETNKMDIGLEASFLGDRIYIMADYYKENTSNLLSSVELPFSNGFTDYVENIGELQQRGWELSARITIIRNDATRLLWSVSGNIAHNEDKIVKLSQAMKAANDKLALQYDYTANTPNKIIREGESQNIIYAVRSLGIDPSTGKELYLNRFGQVTYSWNSADRVNVGLSQPKYRGNFSTMLRYQGFTLNASFGYRFGGQIYNQTLIDKIENADRFFNVDARVYYDRWQKPGDIVAFRGLNETSRVDPSSRFVQNESTLICQNVNLAYDVTSRQLLQRMRMKALQLTVNTGELFYISTVRQERGLDFPFTRQISFQLFATF